MNVKTIGSDKYFGCLIFQFNIIENIQQVHQIFWILTNVSAPKYWKLNSNSKASLPI